MCLVDIEIQAPLTGISPSPVANRPRDVRRILGNLTAVCRAELARLEAILYCAQDVGRKFAQLSGMVFKVLQYVSVCLPFFYLGIYRIALFSPLLYLNLQLKRWKNQKPSLLAALDVAQTVLDSREHRVRASVPSEYALHQKQEAQYACSVLESIYSLRLLTVCHSSLVYTVLFLRCCIASPGVRVAEHGRQRENGLVDALQ